MNGRQLLDRLGGVDVWEIVVVVVAIVAMVIGMILAAPTF